MIRKIKLPTGFLIVDNYTNGELETLSIGDYGKHRNIKADFLGRTQEIHGVANGNPLPLQEKWVITLSTQYGCPMNCTFCDCPKIPFKGNCTVSDLRQQFFKAIEAQEDVHYTDRLNIHFARMGEPAFNTHNVFTFARWMNESKVVISQLANLRVEVIHPVFTTMLPASLDMEHVINEWVFIKNYEYRGQAGLQLSINSTDDKQRDMMFNGQSLSLRQISKIVETIDTPIGRKYCLNFALASDTIIDGNVLKSLFDPIKWMVKLTPIHNNAACGSNGIELRDGYTSYTPYRAAEESCKQAGFDTLVFVPSLEEDQSLITCGNAILSKVEKGRENVNTKKQGD